LLTPVQLDQASHCHLSSMAGRQAGKLHAAAVSGFAEHAAKYHIARRGYAPAAVDCIAQAVEKHRIEPGGKYMVDLGAGTGLLTRSLIPHAERLGECL
jgi:predicted TPR repeat methyltransferase